jgi:hypothetical protein
VNYLNNRLKKNPSLRSNSLVVESRETLDMRSLSTVDAIARQAREYLNTKYTFPKEKYKNLQKDWEIITYIIMPQSEVTKYIQRIPHHLPSMELLLQSLNEKNENSARVIHMARRINTSSNTSSNERLREWMGPLDAQDIESTLIGDTSEPSRIVCLSVHDRSSISEISKGINMPYSRLAIR